MDGLAWLVFLALGIMFGPPLLLVIIGISRQRERPDNAKQLYIAAAVYVVVAGGICASLIA